MAEIAAWQRMDFKKPCGFADGGEVESVGSDSVLEEERVKQEEARELSTIKDVDLKDKKKEKKVVPAPPMAAGNIQMNPDKFSMPEAYQDDNRYQRMLEDKMRSVVGYANGGRVKGKC